MELKDRINVFNVAIDSRPAPFNFNYGVVKPSFVTVKNDLSVLDEVNSNSGKTLIKWYNLNLGHHACDFEPIGVLTFHTECGSLITVDNYEYSDGVFAFSEFTITTKL